MDTESVVAIAEAIFRWDGPKRKQTIISATVGRLVLTDQRLLFLSTGGNDLTVGALAAGAAGRTTRVLVDAKTDHIGLEALANKGSIEVPLARVKLAESRGRLFKWLTVTYLEPDGREAVSAFAPKNGPMPVAWAAEIEAARTGRR